MSYDLSGAPGIWTAVRHWVSVLAGAPGPVQAAYAVPAPTSAGAASIAAIELRNVNLADMCCLLLYVDTTTLFRKCARQPSIGLTRLALLVTYRENCSTVPVRGGRPQKSRARKGKPALLSVFRQLCAGSGPRTFYGFPPVPHFQRTDRTDPFCSHCLILTANSDGFFFGAHLKKLTAWTRGEERRLENLRNKELIRHLQALCHAIRRLDYPRPPPSDQPRQDDRQQLLRPRKVGRAHVLRDRGERRGIREDAHDFPDYLRALGGGACEEALVPARRGRRAHPASRRALADALSLDHRSHEGQPALLVAQSRKGCLRQHIERAPAGTAAVTGKAVGRAPVRDVIGAAMRAGRGRKILGPHWIVPKRRARSGWVGSILFSVRASANRHAGSRCICSPRADKSGLTKVKNFSDKRLRNFTPKRSFLTECLHIGHLQAPKNTSVVVKCWSRRHEPLAGSSAKGARPTFNGYISRIAPCSVVKI